MEEEVHIHSFIQQSIRTLEGIFGLWVIIRFIWWAYQNIENEIGTIRVIQIYLRIFKHDNFTSATKFSCSLSQKQSITGKNFEIGLHLGLVLARQSFST